MFQQFVQVCSSLESLTSPWPKNMRNNDETFRLYVAYEKFALKVYKFSHIVLSILVM